MLALSPTKPKSDPATFPGEPKVAANLAEILLSGDSDDVKLLKIAHALLPAMPNGLSPEDQADIAAEIARMVLSDEQVA